MNVQQEIRDLAHSLDPRAGKTAFDFTGFRRAMVEMWENLTDEQRAYWHEKMEGSDYDRFR